ncbi:MAG: cation:proton antiporter [Burkholderiales bacterium]
MNIILAQTIGLLCAAILVAIIARRLHLPYTVGLVITGIGLAFANVRSGAILTHEFIFDVILPPLLFEAALNLHWRELRKDILPVLTLSTLGVVISAAVVASGMKYLLNWPLAPALIFGVAIAATDPIAVIAMFKDIGAKGRLRLLVESESLFNDGAAAVLFALSLAWVENGNGGMLTGGGMTRVLVSMVGGGIGVGLVCGGAAVLFVGRTADYLIETTVTTVTAYGSFLLAEHFQFSGVLATVSAGLLMGNCGILKMSVPSILSGNGRRFVMAFWDFAAFIANSMVFLLIGLAVANISFGEFGLPALLMTIGLVVVARAVTVYPICFMFRRTQWAIPMPEQHILWWGGLRGALALALALALPPAFGYRNEILIAAFGVVVFSVIAQGLTMPFLLRRIGVLPPSGDE